MRIKSKQIDSLVGSVVLTRRELTIQNPWQTSSSKRNVKKYFSGDFLLIVDKVFQKIVFGAKSLS